MKHKRTMVCLVILGIGTGVQAQESAVASGGDAAGGGGKVAYSIGQILYTTQIASTGTVANGVQQTYEISIVSGLENEEAEISLNAYPNPTLGDLTLTISDTDHANLRVQIFDMHGKLLDNRKITNTIENFSLQNLPASVYFLKVTKDNAAIKTFKIIKN